MSGKINYNIGAIQSHASSLSSAGNISFPTVEKDTSSQFNGVTEANEAIDKMQSTIESLSSAVQSFASSLNGMASAMKETDESL